MLNTLIWITRIALCLATSHLDLCCMSIWQTGPLYLGTEQMMAWCFCVQEVDVFTSSKYAQSSAVSCIKNKFDLFIINTHNEKG